nr:RecName: Full=Antifungal protein Pr-2 [Cucurbita maxima]
QGIGVGDNDGKRGKR